MLYSEIIPYKFLNVERKSISTIILDILNASQNLKQYIRTFLWKRGAKTLLRKHREINRNKPKKGIK